MRLGFDDVNINSSCNSSWINLVYTSVTLYESAISRLFYHGGHYLFTVTKVTYCLAKTEPLLLTDSLNGTDS